ncbi:MAG: formate dehydrogenase subunit gamma [Deltaproteobacteria bacterium]
MSISPDTAAASEEIQAKDDYFTFVEGVGNIPRDIYKHVKSDPSGDLPRYSIHIVIQHFLVSTTFLVLAATGLPLHFSDVFWAPYVIALFGGADTARFVHRIAAYIMMLTAAYHIVTIVAGTIRKILKNEFDHKRTQIPIPKDLFDLLHDVKYFLGLEPFRPRMEKFSYKQKLHYLAIMWGTTVLAVAGMALLFPDIIAEIFPEIIAKVRSQAPASGGFPALFQDLARLMHADEAVMALIVLAFWHLANVHIVPGRFPFQWTFLTGRITREHQIEEHFLEYINNLKEIPAEREYMKNLLRESEFEIPNTMSTSILQESAEEGSGEESTPEKEVD